MEGQMLKGFIDGILLSVLAEGESYGYRIMQSVAQRTNGELEIREGTLYPALRRLEAEGYIAGRWASEEQGARRRYYRITDAGYRSLQEFRGSWEKSTRIIHTFLKEDFAR